MTSETMQIVSVNISEQKGTVKHPVPEAEIDEHGVIGDAHAGTTNRLVSLLGQESIEGFAAVLGRSIAPGEFAENLTVRGLDHSQVAILDRFRTDQVELEVTQIGKACHGESCAIYREVGRCIMPKEGVFCRVVRGGPVKPGEGLTHTPRKLLLKIITVSDRASRGEYEDRSGPRVEELFAEFLREKRWQHQVHRSIIPDDPDKLRAELRSARDVGYDVIVTTGGTGVGPRDMTPDVVAGECSKLIPGVMEQIRLKFGAENPRALLSRGVAGVLGAGVVYTLPGSVTAVEEYTPEIFGSLEHLLFMLRGVDAH